MIFKCQNCGGNIVYNPDKGTMCCPHCEGLDSEDKIISTEYMASCVSCGAPMEDAIGEYTSATKCPNCGTYTILDERVQGEYEPKKILPFKVGKNKAINLLRAEFKNRIFTPTGFLSEASVDKIEGTYVPFFLYDYDTQSKYHGTGTKVRRWTSGGYEYTETSYYDIYRDMSATFDNVPVDASIMMEDGYMDLLEPFKYDELEDFQDKYMSGFYGERYNESEIVLAPRAVEKIDKAALQLVNESIKGYTTVTKNSYTISEYKKNVDYVLLPVWEYIFRFRGENYKFHVNGQTGKIVGKTPVDKKKVLVFGTTVAVMVSIVGLFINMAMMVL